VLLNDSSPLTQLCGPNGRNITASSGPDDHNIIFRRHTESSPENLEYSFDCNGTIRLERVGG
jgi:hypothetical protein